MNTPLENDISNLIKERCGLEKGPQVHIFELFSDRLIIEIETGSKSFGTISKAVDFFEREMKKRATSATGRTKIVYEILE